MNINLDNAVKLKEVITDHSRSGNLGLYKEAQESGTTLTDVLETIDPSELNSPLDAFERQLMVHNIPMDGQKAVSVEQFFVGSGLILLPEFIRREIKRGYQMVQDPTDLIASIVHETGPSITPIYIKTDNAKTSLAKRGPDGGAAYPSVQLLYREKSADIIDRGLRFDFSYRVVKNQRLPEFMVFLHWIGAQLAYDEIDDIYDVLLNGDGTSAAATDVFDGAAGTFAYSDLVTLAMSFDVPAQMTHILATKDDIKTIINLSQFQDPQTWREAELFQRSGSQSSFLPVNSKLVTVPNATATKILALDSRFAVRETVAQPLTIEAEKIINQKLESAVVSKESVYTIMVDDAALLSDY